MKILKIYRQKQNTLAELKKKSLTALTAQNCKSMLETWLRIPLCITLWSSPLWWNMYFNLYWYTRWAHSFKEEITWIHMTHTLVFIFRLEAVVWKKRKPLAIAAAALACRHWSLPCYSLCFFQSFSGELKKNNMTERKMSTNWQKLQGALYCFLSLTSCFIGFFYMYCPILPLLLFNRKLFRKITGYSLSNQHNMLPVNPKYDDWFYQIYNDLHKLLWNSKLLCCILG